MIGISVDVAAVQKWLLVFVRVAGIVGTVPVFGSRFVPVKVKIGVSVALAALLAPLVGAVPDAPTTGALAALIVREFALGAAVGFVLSTVFMGIQLGGQLVGVQMGFGVVNVIDPETREELPIIGQLQYVLALLIFLAVDGHHWVLAAIVGSFDRIPIGGAVLSGAPTEIIARASATVFVTAVRIAAPVTATLLLTDTALALVARAVPQMNVFVVGFPLKIAVGLSLLVLSFPLFSVVTQHVLSAARGTTASLVGAMAP